MLKDAILESDPEVSVEFLDSAIDSLDAARTSAEAEALCQMGPSAAAAEEEEAAEEEAEDAAAEEAEAEAAALHDARKAST